MSQIRDAIMYPTEHDDWIQTVLIGGVLSVFAFLLLPILPVYGYIIRVIRHRLAGDPQPPTFGDWEELTIDGAKTVVIGVVYMLVPGLVGAFTIGGSIAAMATGRRGATATGFAGLLVGMLLTAVLTLIFGYAAVAAVVNFADEREIGAAFDFETIRSVAVSGEYATAWGLSVAVFIAASVVVGVLNGIPLIGAVIGAFVFFYAQVVAAHLWAGGYTDARKGGDGTGQRRVGESAV